MIKLPDIKEINIDLKAEVLATILYERYQLSLNQILINSYYWHQRLGRRDVVDWNEERFSEGLNTQIITLESSRESLFDSLPEGIFIDTDGDINENTNIKTNVDKESFGRKLLLPFQQLNFWLSILVELNFQYLEENIINIGYRIMGVGHHNSLINKIKKTLINISPYLNNIVGNWTITQDLLSFLLGVEITIKFNRIRVYELPENIVRKLGYSKLGVNLCLGNFFNEGTKELEIKLNNLKPNEICGYLPDGWLREQLEDEIIPYLLPLEIPYVIEITADNIFNGFVTDDKNCLLGYTFTI